MRPILHYLCGQPEKEIKELYNHQEDFSGLTAKEANKISYCQEEIFVNVPLDNIVNLLLSSMNNYERLVNKFGSQHLEKEIFSNLVNAGTRIDNTISASIFYTIYEVNK